MCYLQVASIKEGMWDSVYDTFQAIGQGGSSVAFSDKCSEYENIEVEPNKTVAVANTEHAVDHANSKSCFFYPKGEKKRERKRSHIFCIICFVIFVASNHAGSFLFYALCQCIYLQSYAAILLFQLHFLFGTIKLPIFYVTFAHLTRIFSLLV